MDISACNKLRLKTTLPCQKRFIKMHRVINKLSVYSNIVNMTSITSTGKLGMFHISLENPELASIHIVAMI